MSTVIGVLRKRFLAPSLASVGFAERGFPVTHTDATARLEAVPQAVVCGFEWAVEGASLWEIERRLALIEPEQRGFAYEGATMGYTILDAMPGGGRDRTRELLEGPGRPHIFLTYIGIGFAMARLPRPLWKNILPELTGVAYHPVMSWLAVDGYGFDRAYFDTEEVGRRAGRAGALPVGGPPGLLRPGVRPGHRPRAVVHQRRRPGRRRRGGRPVRRAPAGGPVERGGARRDVRRRQRPGGLGRLRRASGEHYDELALGVVFAVKARTYSGYVPAHTQLAAGVLTDLSVQGAQDLADRTERGRR